MNLPFRITFTVFHSFNYFHFNCVLGSFKFPSWFLSWLTFHSVVSSVSTGCYFNFLVSIEACFLSKYVVSFGESSMIFFFFHWNVVWISVRSIFIVLCSSSLSLIDFCLDELSAGETSVLKYSTVTVWVSACDPSFFVYFFHRVGA